MLLSLRGAKTTLSRYEHHLLGLAVGCLFVSSYYWWSTLLELSWPKQCDYVKPLTFSGRMGFAGHEEDRYKAWGECKEHVPIPHPTLTGVMMALSYLGICAAWFFVVERIWKVISSKYSEIGGSCESCC